MLPFMTQPPHAACYVPRYVIGAAQVFRGAQYFERTPSEAAVNRGKGYASVWCQRGKLGVTQVMLSAHSVSTDISYVGFDATDSLWCGLAVGGSIHLITTAKYRDTDAWLHIYFEWDTATADAAERQRLWVNGRRVTAYTEPNKPALGAQYGFGSAGLYRVGQDTHYGSRFFEGLLADPVVGIGSNPGVSAFGEFNIHGAWVPKNPRAVVAAAGINSFMLDFSDPLNPGKDVSGKGNHFTVGSFDAAGKDTVISAPTNRFATLCPLQPAGLERQGTYGDGNLRIAAQQSVANTAGIADLPISTRAATYFTVKLSVFPTQARVGLIKVGALPYLSTNAAALYYDGSGQKSVLGVDSSYGAAWTTQEIGVLCDPVTGTVTFYRDGISQGTIPAPQVFTGGWYPAVKTDDVNSPVVSVNFGQRAWGFTPPAGGKGLCTDNLPEPDIKDPAEGLAQAVATGATILAVLDASTAHWNGEWVEIIKRRDASEDWRVRFSDDPANSWATNNALAKGPAAALTSDGSYHGLRLRVGARYGIWTAEVPHTTGTATTVTHGLNTARNVVIVTRVGGGDRQCRHPDMPTGHLGKINSNAAVGSGTALTAFGPNGFQIASAEASGMYRVIVLAQRDGFLDLTTWKGNGAGDGAFAPLSVSPQLFICRQLGGGSTGAGDWEMLTETTSPINPRNRRHLLNQAIAEDIGASPADFVVGGLKCRDANADWNADTVTYLGIAMGRPVGGVCVAPATAR